LASEEEKREQFERHQKSLKHLKTLAERKALEQQAKERRAREQRTKRVRARIDEDDDGDDLADHEPMHRRGGASGKEPVKRGRGAAPAVDSVSGSAAPHHGSASGLPRARVVGLEPGRARITFESGSHESNTGASSTLEHVAALAEPLARTQRASIAVGDRVFVRELAPGAWRVEAVAERHGSLSRPDATRPGSAHLVAANVDLAIVVVAAAQPAFRPRIVDRYLVALERGGVAPFVAVNKVDLVGADERRTLTEFVAEFESLGVGAALVSTTSGEGVDTLRAACTGRTVVLVGQSGVGKSSLANALFPQVAARTGRVRDGDGKGRHTTTSSHLFAVDAAGTCVIDTPGVRAFGLDEATLADLAHWFPEFEEHRRDCRFSDCTHTHEPVCGVRAAAESGALARRRYEAYLRIREG
jgi:ribosome biogenesis GTPase